MSNRLTLTPEIAAQVVEAFRAGADHALAAKYAGVERRTLSKWIQVGREDPDRCELRAALAREVARAEAEAELRAIKAAFPLEGELSPKDAQGWLERRYAAKYARQQTTVLLDNAIDAKITALQAQFASRPQILAEVLGVLAGDAPQPPIQLPPLQLTETTS